MIIDTEKDKGFYIVERIHYYNGDLKTYHYMGSETFGKIILEPQWCLIKPQYNYMTFDEALCEIERLTRAETSGKRDAKIHSFSWEIRYCPEWEKYV